MLFFLLNYVKMCVYVRNPILVMTFHEWLSGTEPWPPTPSVFVVFCMHMYSFASSIRRTPPPHSVTLQSPTATLIPLVSSSEHTGCRILVCWNGKIVRTFAAAGNRTCCNANNCWHFNIYELKKFHAQQN